MTTSTARNRTPRINLLVSLLAAALASVASLPRAHAQSATDPWASPPSSGAPSAVLPTAPAPSPSFAPAPAATLEFTAADAERASFSGGRYTVEVLASAVGGSLAAYGTFRAICGQELCVGGALAAGLANIAATQLITMGVGKAMGGRGKFFLTFTMGMAGFTATSALSQSNPGLALGISMALMPFLSPLGYELSSNIEASEMKARLRFVAVTPVLVPVTSPNGVSGGVAGLVGRF